MRLALFLLAVALARPALAQDDTFTLAVNGGQTNSSVVLALPARPSWAHAVELDIDHAQAFGLGMETDEWGNLPAHYSLDATLRGGWSLGSIAGTQACRRSTWSAAFAGDCVPFDGGWDWSGASGQHTAQVMHTAASCVVSGAALDAPLVLSTRAQSSVGVNVSLDIPWTGGEGGANVTYLTSSTWTAAVRGRWIP